MSKPQPRLFLRSIPRKAKKVATTATSTTIPQVHSGSSTTSSLHTSSTSTPSASQPLAIGSSTVFPHRFVASTPTPSQPSHIAWPQYQPNPVYAFQRHAFTPSSAVITSDYPLAPAHPTVASLYSTSPAELPFFESCDDRGRNHGRRRSGEKSRSPSRSGRRDHAPEATARVTSMLDGFPVTTAPTVDLVGGNVDPAIRRRKAYGDIHLYRQAAALSGAEYDDPEDFVTRTPTPGSITHAAGGLRFLPGAHGIPKKRHQDAAAAAANAATSRDDSSQGHFLRILEESGDATSKNDGSSAVQVGEDAYFFRPEALGIADGVGGWTSARARSYAAAGGGSAADDDEATIAERARRARADPGLFSRLLMHYCEREVDAWKRGDPAWLAETSSKTNGEGGGISMSFSNGGRESDKGQDAKLDDDRIRRPLDPVEVMQKAYERCMEAVQHEGIFGSATCLLAVLTHDELAVANMGDCAIAVVRDGEIVFRTQEMQHSFNFPIQLGTNSRDEPMKDAELSRYNVKRGDIVVMCTDGLVDNLFDEDILEVIATFAPPLSASPTPSLDANLPPFSPRKVSEALCRAAQVASEETAGASPFMCRAIEEGIDFLGGKKDDISVLVAVVQAEA